MQPNTRGDEHVSWPPHIYVAAHTGRLRRWFKGPLALLSVEIPPKDGAAGHEVRLFEADSQPPTGIKKSDCLEVFFRKALKTLLTRSTFRIKPAITVYGSHQVAAAFGGYQEDILRKALLTAGARDVEFRS